jgi:hypothetical protein
MMGGSSPAIGRPRRWNSSRHGLCRLAIEWFAGAEHVHDLADIAARLRVESRSRASSMDGRAQRPHAKIRPSSSE